MSSGSRIIKQPGVITTSVSYGATAITIVHLTAATTHNLEIPDLGSFSLVEIDSTVNCNVTGIVVPDKTLAWEIKFFNNGVNNIIFKNNDGGSSPDNRFLNGSDITCQPQEGFIFIYRPSVTKWSCPGKNI